MSAFRVKQTFWLDEVLGWHYGFLGPLGFKPFHNLNSAIILCIARFWRMKRILWSCDNEPLQKHNLIAEVEFEDSR